MKPEITVRRLRESEWMGFRSLRLAALRTDPLAFGSTLARESAYTEEKWQDWCRDGATGEQNATFVAEDRSGDLVGMAGTFAAEGTPHVWGMWVRPEWRSRGVGRRLVDALLGWIDRGAPGRPVLLEVNPSQVAAVGVYFGRGFRFSGIEKPLGHDPPAIVRQMVRRS